MNDTASELADAFRVAQEAYNTQQWSTSTVLLLSGLVLVFMVVALILSTILLFRKQAESTEVLKVFGVLSIIGLSTLLLITGYGNEQLTPIVGLFGAISGYLLGKDRSTNNLIQSESKGNNQSETDNQSEANHQ